MELTFKTACTVSSAIIGTACFIPYIKDIYRLKTKPHIYTWIIWTILQVTGVIAMRESGAGIAVLSLSSGAVFCGFISILSIKHGTKNITAFDTFCLIGSLAAIAVYIFMHNPLLSIILISAIDFTGSLPTLRKAYMEPQTETLSMYAIFVFSGSLNMVALPVYSLATALYPLTLIGINFLVAMIILVRRKTGRLPSQ